MANVILDVGLILILSLLGSLISLRYNVPIALGLLITGAIVGPNGLSIISSKNIIDVFIEIGSVLLLFTIGVSFSLSHIIQNSIRALMVTMLKMGLVFLTSYFFCLLFGLSVDNAIIISLILSITSTAIFSGLVKGEHSHRSEISLLYSVLILEDVIGIAIIAFLSSLKAETLKSATINILLPLGVSLLFLGIVYALFERLIKRVVWYVDSLNNPDALILTAFSSAAILSFISYSLNLSFGIGAFLAGSLVSSVPAFKKVEHLLIPFNSLFSSMFFFSIGMLFDWKILFSSFALLVILNIINIISKFSGTFVSTYLLGSDSRGAVFSGLAMLPVGEFSILIAHVAPKSGLDVVSITTTTVVLSSLTSFILLKYEREIHTIVSRHIPYYERTKLSSLSKYLCNLAAYIEPGGRGFNRFLSDCSSVLLYSAIIGIIIGATLIISSFFSDSPISISGITMKDFIYLLGFLLFLAPLANLTRALKDTLETVSEAFLQNEISGTPLRERCTRGIVLFTILFLTSALIPLLFSAISLPPLSSSLAIIPFLMSILFLWDAARTAAQILKQTSISPHLKKYFSTREQREKLKKKII
ncbi:MAG: cation:proton antiporter [Candidatus Anstonellales archaeon]